MALPPAAAPADYPWAIPIIAIISSAATWAVFRYWLRDVINQRLHDQTNRSYFENADFAFGIIGAIGTTSWKLYDIREWRLEQDYVIATVLTSVLLTAAFYSKVLKSKFTLQEKKTIDEVTAEHDAATAALNLDLENTRAARNWLLNTGHMIDAVVREKYNRLRGLLGKEKVNAAEIISREAGQGQILLIVQQIHEFFADLLASDWTLRLGIYFRGTEDHDQFELAYSWDGKKQNCFSDSSVPYLKITRSASVLCELAKCYHSEDGMIIVSDCLVAAQRKEFSYLRPEQEAYIGSIIAYRFNVTDRRDDCPWIIYLDTNKRGFFEVGKKPDYQVFFERICQRISFELVTMELAAKVEHYSLPPRPTREISTK